MAFLSAVLALALCLWSFKTFGAPAAAPGPTRPAPTSDTPNAVSDYYAVTLIASPEPLSTRKIATEFPDKTVYMARDDKGIYRVRVGFFTSLPDAAAFKKQVVASYPGAMIMRITPSEYLALSGAKLKTATAAPKTVKPAPVAKPAAVTPAEPKPAPLVTDSKPSTNPPVAPPKTVVAVRNTVAVTPAVSPAPTTTVEDLSANYPTETQLEPSTEPPAAPSKTMAVDSSAGNPTETPSKPETRPKADAKALPVKTALAMNNAKPAAPLVAQVAPEPIPADASVEERAAALMKRGRDALTQGDNAAAIRSLDQLLKLPPNRSTQEALELMGVARERNGETALAKEAYDRYLKLYPQGEDADRVRQRLANVDSTLTKTAQTRQPAAETRTTTKDGVETTIYGSLAQSYYHGASQIETTTMTGTTQDKSTLSLTDQSTLITNVDLNARFRSQTWDNRVVFRDTHVANFLAGQKSSNRFSSGYLDIKNRPSNYSMRAGRQPASSGGVLNSFDGALFGYSFAPQWRLNAVAGIPVEPGTHTNKRFAGLNLDMGTFAEHWGGNAYVMQQMVDGGTVDRRAVGAELRYFDPRQSVYTLLDYDTLFREVNTFLLQGTWQSEARTTYNFMLDHRRAPALQASNALIGQQSVTTIKDLRETLSDEEIRAQAKKLTPKSDLAMVGASHPFDATWQLGGDVRVSKISGTEAAGDQPAMESTGNVYTYTLQAIGSNILTKRDVSVFSFSYLKGKTFNGQSYSMSNRAVLRDKWTLEPSIRYYQQNDNQNVSIKRLSPAVRLSYQWKNNITLETEAGVEKSKTSSSTSQDDTIRKYYSLGYRWDY